MWRVVAAQVRRRRGRSLAIVSAIVVAAVSFSLLSASVATSRLEVRGTVEENFRSAYDILVRPAGSQTALERSDGLVQENYLSGIFGGITMAQYRQIEGLPDVEVAAPVAMIGYMLPSLFLKEKITRLLSGDSQQLFRLRRSWVSDRGLSVHPESDKYIYYTKQRFDYGPAGVTQTDPVTGKELHVCASFDEHRGTATNAFDLKGQTELSCHSINPPPPAWSALPPGQVGTGLQYPFPMMLAAIDPEQEAALVGLDDAVIAGRYLRGDDDPTWISAKPGDPSALRYRQLPVLMANEPLTDDQLQISVERLDVADPDELPGRLAAKGAVNWLDGLPGSTVRTKTLTHQEIYPKLLRSYSRSRSLVKTQYWSAGQVRYRTASDGHQRPIVRHNPPETWIEPLYSFNGGWFAPAASGDTGFRRLTQHIGSNGITGNRYATPIMHAVGRFDPSLIEGFSRLSQVPLTTYYPPSAAPGDERTDQLLHGKSLAPNSNLAGYLQQPPMMLTPLSSLKALTDSNAFSDITTTAKAPISVIRVRVSGVTGFDELSRERVRLVAEQIARTTGLQVDVTIGTSPTPQLIDLPAGDFGRPELTLREAWVKKEVSVTLLSAIDKKSLALFGLVLLVCLIFLLNASIAAVRTRRSELGVLACVGWPRRRIFALLEMELLATGLIAGVIGTAIAVALTTLLGLEINAWQLAAITPVAMLLAGLAGLWPAWRACHARPIEAITPAVRAPRRARHVGSIGRLALVGVVRWPGRTLLGAASLFVGVAALAALISIQTAFQGGVAGTLLGDVVAVQVRGVDYLAVALTIGLGAFAVADIAYLNIAERTAEVGTLRASGWKEQHLRRLFGTEAFLTAALGAALGAATAVTISAVLLPVPWTTALTAAASASAIGLLAAILALLIPLARLNRLAPANAISRE